MDIEKELQLRKKRRSSTVWLTFTSFMAMFGSLYCILFPDRVADIFLLHPRVITIIGIILFILATGLVIKAYLYIKPFRIHYPYSNEDEDINSVFNYHLKKNLTDKYGKKYEFSDEDEQEIKPQLFVNELDAFKAKYIEQSTHDLEYAHLFEELYKLESKFKSQIERLINNSNLNLIIGISTTSIAIIILGVAIFQDRLFQSYFEVLAFFIPRVSTVIFVEIFSFFFLKLYKQNLAEIKYFQNEITNLNFKISSLKTAIKLSDKDIIGDVVKSFSQTERNVSSLTQTEIKTKNNDVQNLNGIINSITDLIQSVKK